MCNVIRGIYLIYEVLAPNRPPFLLLSPLSPLVSGAPTMTGASFEQEAEAESKVESRASGSTILSAFLNLCTETVPSLLKEGEGSGTKVDKHGLPLIPQPSSDPSDPLNFPQWLKIAILLQVSFLAGLGPLNQAVINPGPYLSVQAPYLPTNLAIS